jgi:alpha,alpha-trehalose phosphorylase
MIRHKRLRPPSHDYPADEWNVIEKGYRPEFLAQVESIMALGNGYLGMRGCPEEGGPNVENSTLINGFYETHPILYGEEAYGFAKTGQTICNVTDTKTIKLFVDDEPFWLPHGNLLRYDRRLNMRAGTLDREILWETPAGKQVLITSRRLVSFPERHVAAVSYCVTLLNAEAHLVISSEMSAEQPTILTDTNDPAPDETCCGSGTPSVLPLWERPSDRAVPRHGAEPLDTGVRYRSCDRDLLQVHPSAYAQGGLWSGCLRGGSPP